MSVSRAYYHSVESVVAKPGETECLQCCVWDAPVRKAGETGYCVYAGVTNSTDTCKYAEKGEPIHGKDAGDRLIKYYERHKEEQR